MKIQTSLAAIATTLAILPLNLVAQTSYDADSWMDDRWYIAPFGAYVFSDSDRKADDGWQIGAAIGKPISEQWNLELRGFYEELDQDGNGPGNYENWGASLDGHWYFQRSRGVQNWGGFQPYAIVGGGFIQDKVDSINADDYSITANVGMGAKWAISDWGNIVADVRYRYDWNKGDIRDEDGFGDVIVSIGLQIPLGAAPAVKAARVAEPVAVAAPLAVEHTVNLEADALFAFDSDELSAKGREHLDVLGASVRRDGFTVSSIQITGHTDPMGSADYNLGLSQRRADVVGQYLLSKGLSSSVVLPPQGQGETRVKVSEDDCHSQGRAGTRVELIECLAPNRRVEAVITGTEMR